MELKRVKSVPDERVAFELSTVSDWPGLEATIVDNYNQGTPEIHMVMPVAVGGEVTDSVRVLVVLTPGSQNAPSSTLLDINRHAWLQGYKLPGWPNEAPSPCTTLNKHI